MKKSFGLFFFTSALAFSQTTPTTTITGPAVVAPGAQVTYNLAITGSSGNLAALQNTVTTSFANLPMTIGVPILLTTKSSMCIIVPVGGSNETCIISGIIPGPIIPASGPITVPPSTTFNDTPIPDGTQVEVITFTVPSTATLGSTGTISTTNTYAVDTSGNADTIGNATFSFTVNTQFNIAITAASAAFAVWRTTPTQANFNAVVTAENAAMAAVGH